ncbi:MAG: hypothetical protein COZ34_04825 [Candidatus Pacebacteria bacterium CG_4_10_14_3_um_filter_34_15]|nr:hypothetical protein [Candidatus Pacearchaeota archaeon]NCQ65539.1 hypothetical protein [Candidatus Paceibacterota bacterium]OIO44836.1 MAG: hypothetical protein AUJ41_01890 [Candidatus Pacebacteria bacterium CG1_02_43_31]PIQ81284.1 MAG: hypothetical protein COV78_00960 [Candidatus Pacebacteria bacterium CG11_big_fil_rev_8_21_14_0_20_34_55]PIX81111.1 MAG: hypothetical protein COZ34_04825 [Candidatus Pacebacteria bacterium CG_4_10_14_3_um_filter_34_15]PJC43830.1 MAG: hypothetical protein CO0
METKTVAISSTNTFATTSLFYVAIFALPMITHGPQLVVGTAVNMMLFLGAKNLTTKELLPLAILPSLGALANGVLFGSLTMLLVYFAPAIWISNYLLMIAYKKTKSLPSTISVVVASIVKATLLFLVALTLFKANVVPEIFLTAMGSVQLTTALAGGLIALAINKSGIINNVRKSKNK